MLRNAVLLLVFISSALMRADAPGEGVSLTQQATVAFRNGDIAVALKHFALVVDLDPSNEFAQTGLIRSLLRGNRIKEAFEAAETARNTLPRNASVATAAGDVLFRMGRFESAETLYRGAVAANPQLARAHLGLARVLGTDFQDNSARAAAATAFRLDPADPEVVLEHAAHAGFEERTRLYRHYVDGEMNHPRDALDWVRWQLTLAEKLGPRSPCQLQGPPRATELTLDHMLRDNGVHEGFKVRIAVNGRKMNFYLDSGIDGLVISRQSAKQLGLEVVSTAMVAGLGDGGVRPAEIALAGSVRLGDLEFHNCPAKTVDRALIPGDGLIGTNLFARFLITLDFARHRLRLRPLPPVQGCLCDDPQRWKELDRRPIPQLSKFAPWRRLGALPLIPTILNGRRTGWFILDTGAETSLLAEEFAREVTYLASSETTIAGISGRIRRAFLAMRVALQFAGFRKELYKVPAVDLTHTRNRIGLEVSGFLGSSSISEAVITIDYRDGLIDIRAPGKDGPSQEAGL